MPGQANGTPRRVSTFGTSNPETAYIPVIASMHSPLCLSSFGSTWGPAGMSMPSGALRNR